MTAANDLAVRRALEDAGVESIDANGGGPGVRLRENKRESELKSSTSSGMARISVGDIDDLLDAVAAVAEPARLNFLWRPVLSDVDDDMVLETAVNGQAEAIVTFNRRHFVSVPKQFGIEVLQPAEIVTELETKS